MEVIREDSSRFRSIGRASKPIAGAREFDDRLASGMQKFCAICPNFTIKFKSCHSIVSLNVGERIDGIIESRCPHFLGYEVSATMQWIDRNRLDRFGECVIRMDDIPVSLKSQIDSYMRHNNCIISRNSENCTMFVERMLSEGNA